jgi:hypothetical protein
MRLMSGLREREGGSGWVDWERRGTICGGGEWVSGREREGTNGDAAVAADDGDDYLGSERQIAEGLGDKGGCADDVESRHAEQATTQSAM